MVDVDMKEYANPPLLKPCVVFGGTAKDGKSGPPVGLVDIGASERAYFFRVSMPGIQKDQNKVRCDIRHDGKVCIHGVISDSGGITNSSSEYQMKLQQLCPPGPFTVSFNLPGPVDPRLCTPEFCPDGIIEVTVMKHRMPGAQPNGW